MPVHLPSLAPIAGLLSAREPLIRRPAEFSPTIVVLRVADLAAFARLEILQRAGIYIAVRFPAAADHLPEATCGEGVEVGQRALNKLGGAESGWDVIIILTCEQQGWGKAQANEGERRFTAMLEASGNVRLVIGANPKRFPLPPEDMQAMDRYVLQARTELVRMGIGLLEPAPLEVAPASSGIRSDLTDARAPETACAPPQLATDPADNVVPLYPSSPSRPKGAGFSANDPIGTRYALSFGGLAAEAVKISASALVVLQGSEARASEIEKLPAYISRHRAGLREASLLVPHARDRNKVVLAQDLIFDSASLAAKTLTGSSQGAGAVWVQIIAPASAAS